MPENINRDAIVLRYIHEHPGMSLRELDNKLRLKGISSISLRRILDRNQDKLRHEGRGCRGSPFIYFTLETCSNGAADCNPTE